LAPENEAGWVNLAREFGLDGEAFQNAMQSEQCRVNLQNEFIRVQQMGVNGFPTVVLSIDNELHTLCRGYTDANSLNAQFTKHFKP
jgi:protein-disulfide isomerase-like protein with CxxC motif